MALNPGIPAWAITASLNGMTSWPCTLTLPGWRRGVQLLSDLFPESESALRNGFAGVGDRRILEYVAAQARSPDCSKKTKRRR
jgi:hypothetical protein